MRLLNENRVKMEIFFQVVFEEGNLKMYSKGIPTVRVNVKA